MRNFSVVGCIFLYLPRCWMDVWVWTTTNLFQIDFIRFSQYYSFSFSRYGPRRVVFLYHFFCSCAFYHLDIRCQPCSLNYCIQTRSFVMSLVAPHISPMTIAHCSKLLLFSNEPDESLFCVYLVLKKTHMSCLFKLRCHIDNLLLRSPLQPRVNIHAFWSHLKSHWAKRIK